MKIGVFDPYLDTLGGGERYMLTLASCLAREHVVSVFWDEPNIILYAEEKFGESYKSINVVKNVFTPGVNIIEKVRAMTQYDRIFFLSDGSIPFLFSKRNFLLLQFPISWRKHLSLSDKLKLSFVSRIIYNSSFVAELNKSLFPKSADVLYPPVAPISTLKEEKTNTILSVGRFTQGLNRKKQEVLINAFQEGPSFLRQWKLILIGSALPSDKTYVQKLREKIKGPSIEIIENPSHTQLSKYYNRAKIYWHAAGFGEDVRIHPERAEHFGISIVEAMSAGCVPIVYNDGGPQEIVEEDITGYFFKSIEELYKKTDILVKDEKVWKRLSEAGRGVAERFSPEKFCKKVYTLV